MKSQRIIRSSNSLIDHLLSGDMVLVTMVRGRPIYSLNKRLLAIDEALIKAMVQKGTLVPRDNSLIGTPQSYQLGAHWAKEAAA